MALSLFRGIGLWDAAFDEAGFSVVAGPDVLWGGDIRQFKTKPGLFDVVFGGPPCQEFSSLARLVRHNGHEPKFGNLVPDFARICFEAQPEVFVMENVPEAPVPVVPGYIFHEQIVCDNWVGGATMRRRRFCFGSKDGRHFDIEWDALVPDGAARAVTGNARILTTGARLRSKERGGGCLPGAGKMAPLELMIEQQGLPAGFLDHCPFTDKAKRQMIGNGVPLPMGRAVVAAIQRALRH